MTDYATILADLFGQTKGDITLQFTDGTKFLDRDFNELAIEAATDANVLVDLVTSAGEAIGLFVPGRADAVTPKPSIKLDDGMIYMIDGAPVPDQQQGVHLCPLDKLTDPNKLVWYLPSELDVKTPSSDVEIVLSQGRNRAEQQGKWKAIKSSFGAFCDFLQVHHEGQKDGPCFLQGETAGGARKAAAMMRCDILGVDLDSGAPLSDVMDTIQRHGLESIIYTTHSHLKDTSVIKKDAFIKWVGGTFDADDIESIREYLIAKKGVLPAILDGLEVIDDAQHTEDGVVILVRHKPMPKFRAVFPLSESFVFSKRGGTQQDAIAEWKERYAGFCTELGLFFDEKCVDPARLFYFPRHKKGDKSFGAWHIVGLPLNLDDYDRVKMRRGRDGVRRPVSSNAFTDAAGGVSDDDVDRYVTATGYNLLPWAGKHAKRLEIQTLLEDLQPDMVREGRGSKAGVHISCPFEDEHTNFGGGGTFVVNASDALEEGRESGFGIVCTHNACSGRDRLDFIKQLCDEELIEVGDLSRKDYLLALEDDEDDEEEEEAPARSRRDRVRGGADDEDAPICPARRAVADAEEGDDNADDDHWGDDEVSMMRAFNKRYAVIVTSGGVKILKEPTGNDEGNDDVQFLTQNDVALLERTRNFYRQEGANTKKVEGFKAWLEWDRRRTFNGVVFAPGRRVSRDIYNLFRGWPFEPKKGSWELLRNHIYESMCDSDDEKFGWFMTWLSHIFQQPDQKPGSTVVIRGEKGTGKSTLFDYVNQLLGRHGITVAQRKQIVGQFNGHLATTLLMVCEEAFWAADPQAEGVLKDMITNKSVLIEKKGYDPVQSQNYTRMALISNSDWVVPASLKDERRFFVLTCNSARIGDTEFFDRLRHQMDHEGGLEAMMYELMTWKPHNGKWASLFKPPVTEGLQQQQIESLSGVHKFMLELVKSGVYETHEDKVAPIELNEDRDTLIYAVDMRAAIQDYTRTKFQSDKAKTSFDDIAPVVKEWFGARDSLMHVDGSQNKKRCFIFPPLSESRAKLKEAKGLDIEVMTVEDVRSLGRR